MMKSNFLQGYTFGLMALLLTGFIFVQLQDILLPVVYAIILSGTLLPWVKQFQKLKIPEAIGIPLVLLMLYGGVVVFSIWIYSRLLDFKTDYPVIQEKAISTLGELDKILKENQISSMDFLQSKMEQLIVSGGEVLGYSLVTIAGIAGNFILTTIYAFLMLYYRGLIFYAFREVMGEEKQHVLVSFFGEFKKVISGYVTGQIEVRFLVFLILYCLLFLSGLSHSFFLAFMGAVLNIIPYLGIFSVGIFTALYAFLMTSSMSFTVWIFSIFVIAHVLEANFLTPKIVGKIINLNPLAAMIVIVVGGKFLGFSGMILSLPVTASLRVILEHSNSLRPWAHFLGEIPKDNEPLNVEDKNIE